MMRHDKPGRRIVTARSTASAAASYSRHAAVGRIATRVHRQKEHVERVGPQPLDEPRIRNAVATMIKPAPIDFDHEPQVKMTSARIGVELLMGRGNGVDPEAGPFQGIAGIETEEAFFEAGPIPWHRR